MNEAQADRAASPSLGLVVTAASATFLLPWMASRLTEALAGMALAHAFAHHTVQAALTLGAMAVLTAAGRGADFGLRLPNTRRDLWGAARWSLAIAALFTLLRYAPNIATHQAPQPDYPLSIGSFVGWSLFLGIYVGPTEEILFRSLVIGLLARARLPGLRVGGGHLSGATLLAAALFAGAHYGSIGSAPWYVPAFQMTYALVLGLIYGHFLEKTGSVVVPMLAHNATDFFAMLVTFGLGVVWR